MSGRGIFLKAMALFACLALAACQSPGEALQEQGYQPATADDLESWFVGKTVKTTGGSDYYSPDGTYVSSWKGEVYVGSWAFEEPNKICWDVSDWGSIPCGEYYQSGDNLVQIYKGKERNLTPADFTEGNTVQ